VRRHSRDTCYPALIQGLEIGFVLHNPFGGKVLHNHFIAKELSFIQGPANWLCFA
jgi:hypothetical protein